jgi:rhodanese-related sulfurtransferase
MAVKIHPLSIREAQALMESGRYFLVDTNPLRRWMMHHIPGSFHLEPAEFTADDLPADKTLPLLFYGKDENCGACDYAAQRAILMGFQQVYTLPAGINGWISNGMPVACYRDADASASQASW